MIKNLLEPDAVQPSRNASEIIAATDEAPSQTTSAPQYVEVNEAEDLFEIARTDDALAVSENYESANRDRIAPLVETFNDEFDFNSPAGVIDETNADPLNFAQSKFASATTSATATENGANDFASPVENRNDAPVFTLPSETVVQKPSFDNAQTIAQSTIEPQSFAETARQSGLAYAAALTLFASVVFMLIVGWFADLLFGSSPWGKVGGIVLGSLIGFIQLFRITSQIFKDKS